MTVTVKKGEWLLNFGVPSTIIAALRTHYDAQYTALRATGYSRSQLTGWHQWLVRVLANAAMDPENLPTVEVKQE